MEDLQSIFKRPKVGPLSVNEKTTIINCFKSWKHNHYSASIDETVERAIMLGVAKSTVHKIIKESRNGPLKSPMKSPGRPKFEIEGDLKHSLSVADPF